MMSWELHRIVNFVRLLRIGSIIQESTPLLISFASWEYLNMFFLFSIFSYTKEAWFNINCRGQFFKMTHFISCSKIMNVSYIDNWSIKLHGLPKSLVSNWVQFTSHFLQLCGRKWLLCSCFIQHIIPILAKTEVVKQSWGFVSVTNG